MFDLIWLFLKKIKKMNLQTAESNFTQNDVYHNFLSIYFANFFQKI